MKKLSLAVVIICLFPTAKPVWAQGWATPIDVKLSETMIKAEIKKTENEINSQIRETGDDIIEAIEIHGDEVTDAIENHRETMATNQQRMIDSLEGILTAKQYAETEQKNTQVMNEGALNHPVSQTACAVATAATSLQTQAVMREELNTMVSPMNDHYFEGGDELSKNGSLAVNANILTQRKFYSDNGALPNADVRADTVFRDGPWDGERQRAAILYLRTAMGLPADPVDLENTKPGSAEAVRKLATQMARVSMAQTTLTDLTNARSSGFRSALKEQSYRLFGGMTSDPVKFHENLVELPPESVPREIVQQLAVTNVLLFEMLAQMDRQSALQSIEIGMLADQVQGN